MFGLNLRSRFYIFEFEYRNAVLSRGIWVQGFDMELVLKTTYTNTLEPQKQLKFAVRVKLACLTQRVRVVARNVRTLKSGVSGAMAEVSRYLFTNG